ncbi:hypothetical protein HS125_16845 [bacterium]|nr:hypothetical protein [bacterium]
MFLFPRSGMAAWLFCTFLLPAIGAAGGSLASEVRAGTDALSVDIRFEGAVGVSREAAGDLIQLPGLPLRNVVAEPQLPWQEVVLLLPEDVDPDSLMVEVVGAEWEELSGEYDLAPAPPTATLVDGVLIPDWEGKTSVVDGRDRRIYGRAAYFPAQPAWVQFSRYRHWNTADVTLLPVAWHPVERRARVLRAGTLVLHFRRLALKPRGPASPAEHSFWPDFAATLANPGHRDEFYAPAAAPAEAITAVPINYAIITTDLVARGCPAFSDFLAHQRARGFVVEVISEGAVADATHYLSGASANQRADNIRAWLKANYNQPPYALKYVLFIGHPHPTTFNADSSVPMKITYPLSYQHEDKECPCDMYFADLSGDWDRDGDGFPGEWGSASSQYGWQDFAAGGIDRKFEVVVGRIPYYNNMADLEKILRKTMRYENAYYEQEWRKKLLLPAAILNFGPEDTDNPADGVANLSYNSRTYGDSWAAKMKQLGTAYGFSSFVLLEKQGVYSEPEVSFPSAACDLPLTQPNIEAEWKKYYGFVAWNGHGSSTSTSRLCWMRDDLPPNPGDRMCQRGSGETSWYTLWSSTYCPRLPDDHPSFVAQVACDNGYPESSSNLGYSLLKNGAIGTISASRMSNYNYGAWSFGGNNGSVAYEFYRRMAGYRYAAGDALAYTQGNLSGADAMWKNCTVNNLYGDPSAALQTVGNAVVLEKTYLTVSGSGCGVFGVKLAAAPSGYPIASQTVTIECLGGDPDICVRSATAVTFLSSNWNVFQDVIVEAAPDADAVPGVTRFRVCAPGVAYADVTVQEKEGNVPRDLFEFAWYWGRSETEFSLAHVDYNGDRQVNEADLLELLARWKK